MTIGAPLPRLEEFDGLPSTGSLRKSREKDIELYEGMNSADLRELAIAALAEAEQPYIAPARQEYYYQRSIALSNLAILEAMDEG